MGAPPTSFALRVRGGGGQGGACESRGGGDRRDAPAL